MGCKTGFHNSCEKASIDFYPVLHKYLIGQTVGGTLADGIYYGIQALNLKFLYGDDIVEGVVRCCQRSHIKLVQGFVGH